MDRKKELELMLGSLHAELGALRDAEADKKNKALLGKCFRTRNNYSCPETDDDRWWLYARVVGIKDGHLEVTKFQNDKKGRLTVENRDFYSAYSLDGYEEITTTEFMAAWDAFVSAVLSTTLAP